MHGGTGEDAAEQAPASGGVEQPEGGEWLGLTHGASLILGLQSVLAMSGASLGPAFEAELNDAVLDCSVKQATLLQAEEKLEALKIAAGVVSLKQAALVEAEEKLEALKIAAGLLPGAPGAWDAQPALTWERHAGGTRGPSWDDRSLRTGGRTGVPAAAPPGLGAASDGRSPPPPSGMERGGAQEGADASLFGGGGAAIPHPNTAFKKLIADQRADAAARLSRLNELLKK